VKARVEREQAWAFLNLMQVSGLVKDALDEHLQETAAMSLAEQGMLIRIATARDGRVRMANLASLMMVSRSGATRIVDRLEQAGLVRREFGPEDRRATFAAVTEKGRALAMRSMPVFKRAVEERFIRFLDAEDVACLRRTLRKVLEGNGVWDDARCSPPFPLMSRTKART